jgi:hypothetical protein
LSSELPLSFDVSFVSGISEHENYEKDWEIRWEWNFGYGISDHETSFLMGYS